MAASKIKRIKTIITLGPNTINKKFLAFANLNVDLLRLNMSHLSILQLTRNIKYVRKYSKIPICIDTEGAQIRTKVKKEKFYKLGEKIEISNTNKNFSLYPESVISQLRKNDILINALKDSKSFEWGVNQNKLFDYMFAGKIIIFCSNVKLT